MTSFTAIDFETANSSRASICSVGLVKVRESTIVDSFYSLIIPPSVDKGFDHRNVAIHSITEDDIIDAPTWTELFVRFRDFVANDTLVAHNVPFDRSCLYQANKVIGEHKQFQWLCTLESSRRLLDLPNYKLPTVANALAVRLDSHHDALADAICAAEVAIELSNIERLI